MAELARHLEKCGPTARVINAVNLLQFDPATSTLDSESFPRASLHRRPPASSSLPLFPSSLSAISSPSSVCALGLVGVLANNLRRVIVIPLRSCRSVNALRFVIRVKTSRLWIYGVAFLGFDLFPLLLSRKMYGMWRYTGAIEKRLSIDSLRARWKTWRVKEIHVWSIMRASSVI